MPEENEEFKYIVRIAATDIDGNKPTRYALTQIKGINYMVANAIINHTGVDGREKIGNMSDEDKDKHLIGTEIELTLREDINLLRKIRSYRGIRHERNLPVRGQRTRSNKRRGLTVGVVRKGRR